mmetsp:Transcript_7957/g.23577  ORF Transcript_7957/g.23577 Transcript_7957/m.23577 type:complete len:86 (+) Transcript_7957:322-579(+)
MLQRQMMICCNARGLFFLYDERVAEGEETANVVLPTFHCVCLAKTRLPPSVVHYLVNRQEKLRRDTFLTSKIVTLARPPLTNGFC